MNGIHDLGGMHGFGPVDVDEGPPTLERWEAAVIAINQAVGQARAGIINLDEFRHGIERMDPAHYLASTYFEHWLDGITRLLVEKGAIDRGRLDERTRYFVEHPEAEARAAVPRDLPTPAPAQARRGYLRPGLTPPRFAVGELVRARVLHPTGHTRLPRYVRGKRGVVHAYHGVHVFPDTNAHGLGEQPQPLYGVRFDATDLWGDAAADPNQSVYLDMWEPYLEPV